MSNEKNQGTKVYCPECGAKSNRLTVTIGTAYPVTGEGFSFDAENPLCPPVGRIEADTPTFCLECEQNGSWSDFCHKEEAVGETPYRYHNYYHCECCHSWEDDWSCMCDDKCSCCGRSVEPYKSDDNLGKILAERTLAVMTDHELRETYNTLPKNKGLFASSSFPNITILAWKQMILDELKCRESCQKMK